MGVGNKLSSWGNGSHYLYDAAGNVTQRYYNGTVNMVWNDRYQMSEAYKNGLLAEAYSFDAYGRRVSVSDGQATTYFIYHGHHVAAEVDSAGQLQRSYTYGAGMDNILSMTIHAGGSAQTYYYLKDHLNTVLALTDESGVVVESYEYDAWGNVRVFDASQTELAQSAFGNRYTFQGREISWATGLYYFRARWYDPVTGRWLSKDPIGISGGLNLYAFCENDPVNNIDPLGLCKDSGSRTYAVTVWKWVIHLPAYYNLHPEAQRIVDMHENIHVQQSPFLKLRYGEVAAETLPHIVTYVEAERSMARLEKQKGIPDIKAFRDLGMLSGGSADWLKDTAGFSDNDLSDLLK